MNIIRLTPQVMDDQTVTTDHYVQSFLVEVRSMNFVHPETLKKIIENKLEVMDVQPRSVTTVVH